MIRGEGLSAAEASELARRIIEYERNASYQRERFEMLTQGKEEPEPEVSDFGVKSLAIAKTVSDALRAGLDKNHEEYEFIKSLGKFTGKVGRQELRKAQRIKREKLASADRYLRRSANQLIKQCRHLSLIPSEAE